MVVESPTTKDSLPRCLDRQQVSRGIEALDGASR
jgi:hypothetical protein